MIYMKRGKIPLLTFVVFADKLLKINILSNFNKKRILPRSEYRCLFNVPKNLWVMNSVLNLRQVRVRLAKFIQHISPIYTRPKSAIRPLLASKRPS